MKFETFISKLLTNKYVLYIITFLAIMNVIGYMINSQYQAVVVFILVGCIMTYFSKNMIIILLTPLLFTALLISMARREGFSDKQPQNPPPPEGAGLADRNTKNPYGTKVNPPPTEGPGFADRNVKNLYNDEDDDDNDDKVNPPPTEGAGLADRNVKNPYDDPKPTKTKETFEVGKKGQNRLDYGSTLEAAYEDLNKALGSDGIRRLTDDTQRLMKQQLELADAMKGMSPMLKQAQDMLKTLNINEIGDITGLIQQMGGVSILKN